MVSLTAQLTLDAQIEAYFQKSEGEWHSQRRYYTLQKGETQEVVSHLKVQFLPQGSDELCHLARLHGFDDSLAFTSGALTSWESNYLVPKSKRPTKGSTIFGVLGAHLYRDRGFATTKPVVADYWMRDPHTLCLRTAYNNNVFEEEVRLVGTQYRTRQSIISRAGQEQMIGQYLESRC